MGTALKFDIMPIVPIGLLLAGHPLILWRRGQLLQHTDNLTEDLLMVATDVHPQIHPTEIIIIQLVIKY